MIAVPEAHAPAILQKLDAVENAAADIAGTLEGVSPITRHDNRLLTPLQPLPQALVTALAQQAHADRGHTDRSDVKFDEKVFGSSALRAVRRLRLACLLKCLGHVPHCQPQVADRTIADQALPVADLLL